MKETNQQQSTLTDLIQHIYKSEISECMFKAELSYQKDESGNDILQLLCCDIERKVTRPKPQNDVELFKAINQMWCAMVMQIPLPVITKQMIDQFNK